MRYYDLDKIKFWEWIEHLRLNGEDNEEACIAMVNVLNMLWRWKRKLDWKTSKMERRIQNIIS